MRNEIVKRRWQTKADLDAFLDKFEGSHLAVGVVHPWQVEGYSFAFSVEGYSPFAIGVLPAGRVPEPDAAVMLKAAWVGYDTRAAVCSMDPLSLTADVDLLTPFSAWAEADAGDHACAVCETAIVAIAGDGGVVWRVDTDLIRDWWLEGVEIVLELDDGSAVRVNLRTGRTVI